ncbi:MAG: pilus assembly protein [Pirellulales bacterium]|nr:pilus assembly protein [Pirellulales bacterium]
MGPVVLQACLPWLAVLVASLLVLVLLARWNRCRLQLERLRRLHRDQLGSVQSLSFVLTLPLFVMIMLFIVQVSQLMIATIVVHYAAFAAARSAIVWIPAGVDSQLEGANCISDYVLDPNAEDQVMPILDPTSDEYGPADGGLTYLVTPGSPKHQKIASAAVLACMPIAPSRDLGQPLAGSGPLTAESVKRAYAALDAESGSNTRISARLENKLAYAMRHTDVEVRFFHKNREPPLTTYYIPHDPSEFRFNELGWQDLITVTVRHKLALLPGPGRLLARVTPRPGSTRDVVSEKVENLGNVYAYPLEASATLGNEGQKSVRPYAYELY